MIIMSTCKRIKHVNSKTCKIIMLLCLATSHMQPTKPECDLLMSTCNFVACQHDYVACMFIWLSCILIIIRLAGT